MAGSKIHRRIQKLTPAEPSDNRLGWKVSNSMDPAWKREGKGLALPSRGLSALRSDLEQQQRGKTDKSPYFPPIMWHSQRQASPWNHPTRA
jgi:hypothetical protein